MINVTKKIRNFLLASSVFILLIMAYASYFYEVKDKEIPKTVYVIDETKYNVEFKTKLIINKMFEIDSVYIKYDYMIEPLYINNVEISAHVVKNPMFENQYIVFMSKKLKPYAIDIVLSHELQHVYQFESKDLEVINLYTGTYRYKEDTLVLGTIPYSDRPEEIDAYAKEDSIYNQLQILLKEY